MVYLCCTTYVFIGIIGITPYAKPIFSHSVNGVSCGTWFCFVFFFMNETHEKTNHVFRPLAVSSEKLIWKSPGVIPPPTMPPPCGINQFLYQQNALYIHTLPRAVTANVRAWLCFAVLHLINFARPSIIDNVSRKKIIINGQSKSTRKLKQEEY